MSKYTTPAVRSVTLTEKLFFFSFRFNNTIAAAHFHYHFDSTLYTSGMRLLEAMLHQSKD